MYKHRLTPMHAGLKCTTFIIIVPARTPGAVHNSNHSNHTKNTYTDTVHKSNHSNYTKNTYNVLPTII